MIHIPCCHLDERDVKERSEPGVCIYCVWLYAEWVFGFCGVKLKFSVFFFLSPFAGQRRWVWTAGAVASELGRMRHRKRRQQNQGAEGCKYSKTFFNYIWWRRKIALTVLWASWHNFRSDAFMLMTLIWLCRMISDVTLNDIKVVQPRREAFLSLLRSHSIKLFTVLMSIAGCSDAGFVCGFSN